MLTLKGMPCDAARRRGLLWHSWLKNQILKIDAGYIAYIHDRPDLQDEKESFEGKIREGGDFESRLSEARQLARDTVDGFSPSQLVDSGPLAILSPEARESIKSTIHCEYLKLTRIEEQTSRIDAAIDDLESALKEFSAAWYGHPPNDHNTVHSRFEHLQACARTLHERLGELPQGIVLP